MAPESDVPKISVVIPARNEEGYIGRCIQSVLEADYPADRLEVVVVDGMSEDRTAQIVRDLAARDSRVRLVPNPRRITPVAFNLGIQSSTGDIVSVICGHSILYKDYFKLTLASMREHPEAWCVGGIDVTVSENLTGRAIAAATATRAGAGNAHFRLGNYHGYADTVVGSYWRWVFDKIGLYDEELIRNQDDELNFRVIKGGGKIWLNSDIKDTYFNRGSFKGLARQYNQYGFWRMRTIQKHRQPASLRQIAPLMFVCLWLALIAASALWHPLGYVLAAYAAAYACLLAVGTVEVCRREGLRVALLAPAVFVVLHFCYGFGSLRGIWSFYVRRRGRITDQPLSR